MVGFPYHYVKTISEIGEECQAKKTPCRRLGRTRGFVNIEELAFFYDDKKPANILTASKKLSMLSPKKSPLPLEESKGLCKDRRTGVLL